MGGMQVKIKQDVPQFTPITITIETREEAEALWLAVRAGRSGIVPAAHLAFYINLANWFSNESRL